MFQYRSHRHRDVSLELFAGFTSYCPSLISVNTLLPKIALEMCCENSLNEALGRAGRDIPKLVPVISTSQLMKIFPFAPGRENIKLAHGKTHNKHKRFEGRARFHVVCMVLRPLQ